MTTDHLAQLNADRRANGEFGEHEHTAPELTLEGDESEHLFSFERTYGDFDVFDEGEGSFSVHATDGGFITGFTSATSVDDHDGLEIAAEDALSRLRS